MSIAPFVEKHVILYSATPSFCYWDNRRDPFMPCPDTREELQECVREFYHVEWVDGIWGNESDHRNAIFDYLGDAELVIPVDADEIWDPFHLKTCIMQIERNLTAREWRVNGFQHMWRSFFWRCTDVLAPVRFIDMRAPADSVLYTQGLVFHFGYAVSEQTIRYKWNCHGHQNELRDGWLEEKYLGWRPGVVDVHPTNEKGWWKPEYKQPTDMPDILWDHPYWEREIIE